MIDYIKREDAMELINKCVSHTSPKAEAMDFRHGEMNGLNWAYDIIEAMPSADAAPVRHGKWNAHGEQVTMYDIKGNLSWGNWFVCTDCGFATTAIEGHITQYKYCPACGARMDGEK